jgi:tripartite-type tricarboxylate transporter receptor subunit TctC
VRRLIFAVAALGLSAASFTGSASAQYPDRPVKMIVPWAAGGDTDNIFRPLAPLLQKHLGQPVVIANVGGASGTTRASPTSPTRTSSRSAASPRRRPC